MSEEVVKIIADEINDASYQLTCDVCGSHTVNELYLDYPDQVAYKIVKKLIKTGFVEIPKDKKVFVIRSWCGDAYVTHKRQRWRAEKWMDRAKKQQRFYQLFEEHEDILNEELKQIGLGGDNNE